MHAARQQGITQPGAPGTPSGSAASLSSNARGGSAATNSTNVSNTSNTTNVRNVTNVTNVTNVNNVTTNATVGYGLTSNHVKYLHHHHHQHRPFTTWWWDPYVTPGHRLGSFFAFHFGHGSKWHLQFKFSTFGAWGHHYGGYGYWNPWCGYVAAPTCHAGCVGSCACVVWAPVKPSWRPSTICYTLYPRTYSYLHFAYTSLQPMVREVAVPVAPEPCPYTFGEAWRLIADGQTEAALTAFSCLAQAHPDDGLAHIGYAIANAMIEPAGAADDAALIAMRHAVTIDPDAIRYVPSDPDLDAVLTALLDHYVARAQEPQWRSSGLFMMASLMTALGDYTGAHFTIGEAINSGDNDVSARSLRDVLHAALQEQLYAQ